MNTLLYSSPGPDMTFTLRDVGVGGAWRLRDCTGI